ncbi:tumor necrosis factor ligand superfamily member 13 [Megalops cyprinoides]|uniref:tumor necrosis factor ligand superfamily member 13 n=1 Tax=Megalops cyprinoides TaxID=118141 RepID=UPI001864C6F9|nr:tumor necrosis factor ligand superfamily member 13 [Megalops cyprinoides]
MLTAFTCLGLLLIQAAQIHRLREELWGLKLRVGAFCGEETDAARCGVPTLYGRVGTLGQDEGRMRREAPRKGARRLRQTGQSAFLHLQPLSSQSFDEEDKTVLKWTVGQSQGEGLNVSGEAVTVITGGLYFIYSQVLYEDSTYVMGHVIRKRIDGNEVRLMKCMKSMPDNITYALNTCYTAGIQYLEAGSVLELSIPRKNAGLDLQPHSTFMGIYKL